MARTYKRTCIKDFEIIAENGDSFKTIMGKEYITSPVYEDNTVLVFSTKWVRVPADNFSEGIIFTKN